MRRASSTLWVRPLVSAPGCAGSPAPSCRLRYASSMPPRPKYTSLDDSLYDYLVSHRSPDDAVVEELREELAVNPELGMLIFDD